MLIRETVRPCADCNEVTPHSQRVIALPGLFVLAARTVAVACLLLSEPWWIAGGLLLVLADFVTLSDRDRHWSVACERCRARCVAEVRASNPRLGSTTILDWF